MQRLFVALELPDYARDALGQLEEPIRGVTWAMPENRHLTLFFLGETPVGYIKAVQSVLRQIEVNAFFLPIKGIGHFPAKGQARVLWVGVGNGHPHLFQLQHRITNTLFSLGFDPGERIWQPHITLGRCGGASPEALRQYLKKNRDFETAPVRVTEFHLYASERRGGRRYYPLVETFPLTAV